MGNAGKLETVDCRHPYDVLMEAESILAFMTAALTSTEMELGYDEVRRGMFYILSEAESRVKKAMAAIDGRRLAV